MLAVNYYSYDTIGMSIHEKFIVYVGIVFLASVELKIYCVSHLAFTTSILAIRWVLPLF